MSLSLVDEGLFLQKSKVSNQQMTLSLVDEGLFLQESDIHCWPPQNEYRNPSLFGEEAMHFLWRLFLHPQILWISHMGQFLQDGENVLFCKTK